MEKNNFEYKKLLEIKKMSIQELSAYYRKLRSYEYDQNKPLESSKIKKKIYFLTKLILKIDRLLTSRKLILFDDKRSNDISKGKVYASSHVGRYDIESAMEAIGEQVYFVMGDPEETYRNFEGFFLDKIQGRICMDTGYNIYNIFQKYKEGKLLTEQEKELYDEYKKDRHICEVTCTRRIANKDNILIYPEGAWNVTPRLTQSLFPGAARIAVNGNGVIIPIGITRDSKKYTVNIGKEIDVTGASEKDVKDITNLLKEKMNSLVGEIIFSQNKIISRASLKDPYQNELDFINNIMSESENGYTLDIIEKTRYYDSNSPENVVGINYTKRL
ncbi:MAG: hypothetical protein ILA19_04245 [Bacilli bacterium]|nr:hypothetical protein [Bacilli bacterium]